MRGNNRADIWKRHCGRTRPFVLRRTFARVLPRFWRSASHAGAGNERWERPGADERDAFPGALRGDRPNGCGISLESLHLVRDGPGGTAAATGLLVQGYGK